MSLQKWEQRYLDGDLPWDTGQPDEHLIRFFSNSQPQFKKVLEIGCGTGTNANWLAGQGLDVTAIDLSPKAIEIAKQKAAEQNQQCNFIAADFLCAPELQAGFDFAFDRGCFHSFPHNFERAAFAQNIAALLVEGGTWLSLIGSTDGAAREDGPPRRSALDIAAAVEAHFEIRKLIAIRFSTSDPESPEAWFCLMRKRSVL